MVITRRIKWLVIVLVVLIQATGRPRAQGVATDEERTKIRSLLKTIDIRGGPEAANVVKELVAFGPKAVPVLVDVLNSDKSCLTQWVAGSVVASIDPQHPIAFSTLSEIARGHCTMSSPAEMMLKRQAAMTLARELDGIPVAIELLKSSELFIRQSGAFALHDLLEVIDTDRLDGIKATPELVKASIAAIQALKAVLGDADEIVRCVAEEGLQRATGSKNRAIVDEARKALKGAKVKCSR